MTSGKTGVAEHVEHFRWRVLQDALAEATATYWERRAAAFAIVGNALCDQVAQNCRNHAWLLRDIGLDGEAQQLIAQVLAEHNREVA